MREAKRAGLEGLDELNSEAGSLTKCGSFPEMAPRGAGAVGAPGHRPAARTDTRARGTRALRPRSKKSVGAFQVDGPAFEVPLFLRQELSPVVSRQAEQLVKAGGLNPKATWLQMTPLHSLLSPSSVRAPPAGCGVPSYEDPGFREGGRADAFSAACLTVYVSSHAALCR